MDEQKLKLLIDKTEITEAIHRWCRGCDRADEQLMASVYHEDAVDLHGPLEASGAEMSSMLAEFSHTVPYMSHHVSNILIEIEGDVAFVETYCLVTRYGSESDGGMAVMGARYLDRFERRRGEWKVADRKVVSDWQFSVPGERTAIEGLDPAAFLRGAKKPYDPVYAMLRAPTSPETTSRSPTSPPGDGSR